MDLEKDMNGKRKTGRWVWELMRSGESSSRIDIDTVESCRVRWFRTGRSTQEIGMESARDH